MMEFECILSYSKTLVLTHVYISSEWNNVICKVQLKRKSVFITFILLKKNSNVIYVLMFIVDSQVGNHVKWEMYPTTGILC